MKTSLESTLATIIDLAIGCAIVVLGLGLLVYLCVSGCDAARPSKQPATVQQAEEPERPAERMKEIWAGRAGAFILHDNQTGADYLLNGSGGILRLEAQ